MLERRPGKLALERQLVLVPGRLGRQPGKLARQLALRLARGQLLAHGQRLECARQGSQPKVDAAPSSCRSGLGLALRFGPKLAR